jgi:hypothetical protein
MTGNSEIVEARFSISCLPTIVPQPILDIVLGHNEHGSIRETYIMPVMPVWVSGADL